MGYFLCVYREHQSRMRDYGKFPREHLYITRDRKSAYDLVMCEACRSQKDPLDMKRIIVEYVLWVPPRTSFRAFTLLMKCDNFLHASPFLVGRHTKDVGSFKL